MGTATHFFWCDTPHEIFDNRLLLHHLCRVNSVDPKNTLSGRPQLRAAGFTYVCPPVVAPLSRYPSATPQFTAPAAMRGSLVAWADCIRAGRPRLSAVRSLYPAQATASSCRGIWIGVTPERFERVAECRKSRARNQPLRCHKCPHWGICRFESCRAYQFLPFRCSAANHKP